jgi:hypothetical protein
VDDGDERLLSHAWKAWHTCRDDVIDLAGARVVAKIDGERKSGVFSELAR